MTEEQVITQHIAEPVHVTITRNAKGDIQYEVSVHGDRHSAIDVALDIEEQLAKKYPKKEDVTK